MRMFDDIRSSAKTSSVPAFNVDISEDESGFHIDAELPGLAKDEIALNIEDYSGPRFLDSGLRC